MVEACTFEDKEKYFLNKFPSTSAHISLKKSLLKPFAAQIRISKTNLIEKKLGIQKKLIAECSDSFICLAAMGDMADIYISSGRYEDAKNLLNQCNIGIILIFTTKCDALFVSLSPRMKRSTKQGSRSVRRIKSFIRSAKTKLAVFMKLATAKIRFAHTVNPTIL